MFAWTSTWENVSNSGVESGLLSHFLNSPLPDFLMWYRQVLQDYPKDYDADILPLIACTDDEGAIALQVRSAADAKRVDCMMELFYGSCGFEESVEPHLLVEADVSFLKVDKYLSTDRFISKHLGADAMRLWDFLREGRGIGRPDGTYPYCSEDGDFKLSFWTYDEVALFRQRPLDYGSVEAIPKQAEEERATLSAVSRAIDNVYPDGMGWD